MVEKQPEVNVQDTPKQLEAPVESKETNEQAGEPEEWKKTVERIAQSAADRVRTEYVKKLKDAQKEIEALRTERMSENERREYEAQQLKEALDAKERDLTRREMELLAVKTLEEKKLPSGFVEFVIGDSVENTQARIAQLEKTFADELKTAVDGRMKAYGREPGKGRGTDTNSFEGMTPKEIKDKAHGDLEWFRKNEDAIIEHYKGGYKK
jgi:hypothetical protein